MDRREDQESATIIKEEVDLDSSELSEEEDTLFADPVETEIMDLKMENGKNPENGLEQRVKRFLADLKLRDNLYVKCYRGKGKQYENHSASVLFSARENRYNLTVKEIMKRILNENNMETKELRRNWVKFRGKIYQSRYRARLNGRLNMETEKMLQLKVDKYMARMFLDYEEILTGRRLSRGLVQQFSSENVSQR